MNSETAIAPRHKRGKRLPFGVDAQVGSALIEVKVAVDALRTVRTGIMNMAYAIARRPESEGFLVLVDSAITRGRLVEEWENAATVLRPDVVARLTLCLKRNDGSRGGYFGIPRTPSPEIQKALDDVVRDEAREGGPPDTRTDYSLVLLKLLVHRWLTGGEPVTADWLKRTAGCSYPTVARVLKELGNVVERGPNRRVGLRYFPHEEFSRLLANAGKLRTPIRFADHSGQPRSPEAHLRRLENRNVPDLAVGGGPGALHYFPDLDLVGTPRLDLSLHCPGGKRPDTRFIEAMDPALKREDDPQKPASVVVHVVRHADSLFTPRGGGLYWADQVECLLDLYEARLESQATQFLEALQRKRNRSPHEED